ncbi:hypothetical protein [Streptomyces sp. SID3343]|nr:hypothetical protein [Streptomyces sp. SID3343]MYW04320.1 hypothetical protein [Streptomyces sp. SID3343]
MEPSPLNITIFVLCALLVFAAAHWGDLRTRARYERHAEAARATRPSHGE